MPAPAGEVHVEEDDVGPGGPDDRDRVLDRIGLTDDFDGRRADPGPGQLGPHSGPDERMVVDEHEADGGGHGLTLGMRISTSVPTPG